MTLLESIWHFLFGWPSVAILVGIVATAVAILEPPAIALVMPRLRSLAIMVAVVAFSLTALMGKFYNDGLAEKQHQLDAGLAREAINGEKAYSDAVRALRSAAPSSVRDDPRNRDNGKLPVSK
jgi:uncharacterized protein involved in cysteine biosynthesis